MAFYARFDPACYTHHFVTLRGIAACAAAIDVAFLFGRRLLPSGYERFFPPRSSLGQLQKWPGRHEFFSYWHEMERSPDGTMGNSFFPRAAEPLRKSAGSAGVMRNTTPLVTRRRTSFCIVVRLLGHWRGITGADEALQANALRSKSYVTDRWTKNPVNPSISQR